MVRDNPTELFDLKSDPGENVDLAEQNQNVLRRLVRLAREAHTPKRRQDQPDLGFGWGLESPNPPAPTKTTEAR